MTITWHTQSMNLLDPQWNMVMEVTLDMEDITKDMILDTGMVTMEMAVTVVTEMAVTVAIVMVETVAMETEDMAESVVDMETVATEVTVLEEAMDLEGMEEATDSED